MTGDYVNTGLRLHLIEAGTTKPVLACLIFTNAMQ